MLDVTTDPETKTTQNDPAQGHKSSPAPVWQTPKLEDVSEQVMAQPYIRFT